MNFNQTVERFIKDISYVLDLRILFLFRVMFENSYQNSKNYQIWKGWYEFKFNLKHFRILVFVCMYVLSYFQIVISFPIFQNINFFLFCV